MRKDISLALEAYILLLVLSFLMSIVLGLGKAESLHEPSSFWLYGRRALMVILAVAVPWLTGKKIISVLGWKLSIKWALISLSVGVCIGFSNPGGFDPRRPTAIILAFFHTFSTELFFRGYLFRTLASSFKRLWTALLLSSVLYGFFYLTVWGTWTLPVGGIIIFIALFTTLGMLFAYAYRKSGSFLVPWMMHFFGVLKYSSLF